VVDADLAANHEVMSTDYAWAVTPESPQPARPARPPRTGLLSPRSWAELLYSVLDLAPAIAFFVTIVTLLSVGLGLAIIYIGLPILALGLLVARLGGLVQRSLALAMLDLPGVAPAWARPRRPGPTRAIPAAPWRTPAAARTPRRTGGDLPRTE
jgi:hypothetical protein